MSWRLILCIYWTCLAGMVAGLIGIILLVTK